MTLSALGFAEKLLPQQLHDLIGDFSKEHDMYDGKY